MGDDYEDNEYEEESEDEDFQEQSEAENVLRKRQESVFCPRDSEYMPYHVKGAIVVRKCPKCGFETEGGS
jgi:NADH pyrophosphatase NudC (nudix superfamily)